MTLEQVIYEALTGSATVVALVGDRIYPDWNEVPVTPDEMVENFVVYQLESETQDDVLEGLSGTFGDLMFTSVYSLTVAARTSDQKAAIVNACKDALYVRPADSVLTVMNARLSACRDETTEDLIAAGYRVRTLYWEFRWRKT